MATIKRLRASPAATLYKRCVKNQCFLHALPFRTLQRRRKNRAHGISSSAHGPKRHRAPLICCARFRALDSRARACYSTYPIQPRCRRCPRHPATVPALPRPIPAPRRPPPPPSSHRRPSRATVLRRAVRGRSLPLGTRKVFDKTPARYVLLKLHKFGAC